MSEPTKRPGNPNMRPGAPSVNPLGRPRGSGAFGDRVRQRIDPDVVIDLALEAAADTSTPAATRLDALLKVIDRGYTKPATSVTVTATTGAPAAFADMSDEELRAEIAKREAQLLGRGDQGTGTPMVTVEESRIAPLLPPGTENV
jgi:hypothetical protein